jgi:hypothetical protein
LPSMTPCMKFMQHAVCRRVFPPVGEARNVIVARRGGALIPLVVVIFFVFAFFVLVASRWSPAAMLIAQRGRCHATALHVACGR